MFPRKAVLRLGRYDVAVRYRPADELRLGGDWYDARLGADGSAVVVVGDVAGHGPRAAAAMVRICSALRGLSVTGLPARFVRKEAKTYGTCQLAEGGALDGRRVTVVEDVVTSGGQVVLSCADLRERGAVVAHALCVIDREAGGPEALRDIGVEARPLFTMSELKAAVA